MQSFVQRMIGAAKLDAATYEEVEHDHDATMQAAGVVLLSSLAAGIGALALGFGYLILGLILALIGWVISAAIIWVIGTKLLPEAQTDADLSQLLRTLGFASTPGLLRLFGFIPILGWIISLIGYVWMLIATIVAARQALDFASTGRAVGVCVIAWIVEFLVSALFGISAFSGPAG